MTEAKHGPMTPDDAYARLRRYFAGSPDVATSVLAAWQVLDDALSADGTLPEPWERLTGKPAAERAGRPANQWNDLTSKGWAPDPDGIDPAGRKFWHPATVDAWREGRWVRRAG